MHFFISGHCICILGAQGRKSKSKEISDKMIVYPDGEQYTMLMPLKRDLTESDAAFELLSFSLCQQLKNSRKNNSEKEVRYHVL